AELTMPLAKQRGVRRLGRRAPRGEARHRLRSEPGGARWHARLRAAPGTSSAGRLAPLLFAAASPTGIAVLPNAHFFSRIFLSGFLQVNARPLGGSLRCASE